MVPELRRDTMAPQWWSQAYDDLAAAEALLRDRFHAAWVIAYHAQQAAEKFIKAYLVACGMSSDERGFRTHEIDDLRLLVRRFDEELAEFLAVADGLSEYAVEARYPAIAPGIDEQVSPDDARRAVELAQQVEARLREVLEPILPRDSEGTEGAEEDPERGVD
jgi:HEPN domain-containing protein